MLHYADSEIDPVFRAVVGHWISKIRNAQRHKREVFGNAARECQSFYDGPKDWDELMGTMAGMGDGDGFPLPDFKVSVNKTFEFVTIFGPSLYYENPVRTVRPRMPVQVPPEFFPNPMLYQSMWQQEDARVRQDGLRGVLLETMLNWTPREFRLAREARCAIDEALIKGRGLLWTDLYTPPGANFRVVRTTSDSVDHLFCDPDADSFDNCKWIARRRFHPTWYVERLYGLRPGSVKGNCESNEVQSLATVDENLQFDRKRGLSNDLICYYQFWSKMGIGGRLAGLNPGYRKPLEMFGDYCYIVVADSIPFPLNMPPDLYNDPSFANDPNQVYGRIAWPIPFWADDEWPCTALDFHTIHGCPWPLGHLKAGMGELKFLNWVMSFLMSRIRMSCRDFIAMKKSVGEEIKTTILEGRDLALLELDSDHGTIQELVSFLQHPEVNGDVWKMIQEVERNFDKRVGLTELMYGGDTSTQIRSASEVNLRNQNMNIRPEDMGKQVEAWMSDVAAKEAFACRYHLRADDVQPVLGAMGSYAWDTFVATTDVHVAAHQLEYSVEAGSTRRPNKEWEAKTMTDMFQYVSPLFQAYSQQTGDMTPLNNLLSDLAKSRALDPNRYMLKAAIPPPMPTLNPEAEPSSANAPPAGEPTQQGTPPP